MRSDKILAKKVGSKPSHRVMATLRKRHPAVELRWAENIRRWVLVQVMPAPMTLIRCVTSDGSPKGKYETPTLANSVYLLDRMHPRNFNSAYKIQRFLNRIDSSPQVAAMDKENAQRIRDGSSELFDVIHKRVVVPVSK